MSSLSTAGTIVSRKTFESANTVHKSSNAACRTRTNEDADTTSVHNQGDTHICSAGQGRLGVQDPLYEQLGHLFLLRPSVFIFEQFLVRILLLGRDLESDSDAHSNSEHRDQSIPDLGNRLVQDFESFRYQAVILHQDSHDLESASTFLDVS